MKDIVKMRIARAAHALNCNVPHQAYTYKQDYGEAVRDLLTDLRHLCQEKGVCFDKALLMSEMHFEAEGGNAVPEEKETKEGEIVAFEIHEQIGSTDKRLINRMETGREDGNGKA